MIPRECGDGLSLHRKNTILFIFVRILKVKLSNHPPLPLNTQHIQPAPPTPIPIQPRSTSSEFEILHISFHHQDPLLYLDRQRNREHSADKYGPVG